MSVAVAESSGCFLSALQPNTSRTAYVVPSDGPPPDPVAKARRVREQVRMRLAEKKKSSSLPRLDDTLVSSTGETRKNKTNKQSNYNLVMLTRLLVLLWSAALKLLNQAK